MPRNGTINEVARFPTKVYGFTLNASTPVNTTLSGAEAVGQSVLSLTSATGAVDLLYYFLNGTGGIEVVQQTGAPAANDITITTPLLFAQGSGAAVKEADRVDLGYIDVGGWNVGVAKSVTEVQAANSAVTLVYIDSPISITGAFNVLSFNIPNFLLGVGLVNNEAGDGAAYTTAYRAGIGPASESESLLAFRLEADMHDGYKAQVDLLGARMSSSGQITVNRQGAATIPYSISAPQAILRISLAL